MNLLILYWDTLREKCPYSELFWSVFSRIWTEYGEILHISPYSVRMLEKADQNSSEYGHFLRNEWKYYFLILTNYGDEICRLNRFLYIVTNLLRFFVKIKDFIFESRIKIIPKFFKENLFKMSLCTACCQYCPLS